MESTNYLLDGVKELTNEDLKMLNGGSFMYDLGFLIREMIIYTANGANAAGYVAVSADLGLNYRPIH